MTKPGGKREVYTQDRSQFEKAARQAVRNPSNRNAVDVLHEEAGRVVRGKRTAPLPAKGGRTLTR